MQPNADHSLDARLVNGITDLVVFMHSLNSGISLPAVNWTVEYSYNSSLVYPSITFNSYSMKTKTKKKEGKRERRKGEGNRGEREGEKDRTKREEEKSGRREQK